MSDQFTDTPDYTEIIVEDPALPSNPPYIEEIFSDIQTYFPNPEQEPDSSVEDLPADSEEPSVSDEIPLDEIPLDEVPSVTPELPEEPVTVPSPDYTELLAEIRLQNEKVDLLVLQAKELNVELANISSAASVGIASFGIVTGVLLLLVFVIYFRS